jgi:hypothetical protein
MAAKLRSGLERTDGKQSDKRALSGPMIREVWMRQRVVHAVRPLFEHHDQFIGRLDWERTNRNRVEQREHGQRQRHPDHKREARDDGDKRAAPCQAPAETEVLPERVHAMSFRSVMDGRRPTAPERRDRGTNGLLPEPQGGAPARHPRLARQVFKTLE